MPLENDISFLKSRLQYDETKFSKFLHIYPTRQQVEMYNNNQLSKLANTIRIYADHFYASEDDNFMGQVLSDHIPSDDTIAGGLRNLLMVSVGARVMLMRNIKTENGLVNGAIGTIVNIIFSSENNKPSCIYVKFDDPKIGRVMMKQESSLHSPVAIEPYEHKFVYRGRHVVRSQFPLMLSWACTIHKVQGISLNSAVIDLGSTVFEFGMAYVALSRVTSSTGLILINFDPSKIKASEDVIVEYERLKNINK